MLTILGLSMITVFTILIMSNRMTSFTALTLVPLLFALIAGFGTQVDTMMLEGIKGVASSAAFLLFALLFFGIMIDAGLFDPLIKKVLKTVKRDPVKIAIGTAVLTALVALDGDGTTTFMIVVSSMLPLYKRINMNPLILATTSMLSFSIVSGLTPWGGPAVRSLSVLGFDQTEFFVPLIPTLIGGVVWVLFLAYVLGKAERKRIGIIDVSVIEGFEKNEELAATIEQNDLTRPKLIWVNLFLTIAVMTALICGIMEAATLFLIGAVVAMMINYPSIEQQKNRIKAHTSNAITAILVVFAGGAFAGILEGTKMVDALAGSLVSIIPDSWNGLFPVIVGLVSILFNFAMSNDAYYFGVVPVLAETAVVYGIDPIQVVRAAVLAQPVHFLLPLVSSTILLIGMLNLEIGSYLRFALKWSVLTSLVLIVLALITGGISISL